MQELLSKHKTLCAEFLEANYDKIFGMYTNLLNSENYATRRQSLKLLGELLLDRANFSIMTRCASRHAFNVGAFRVLLTVCCSCFSS